MSCVNKVVHCLCTATIRQPKQHKLLEFDPRHPADRHTDAACCLEAVKQLTELCPDTSVRHLWGVSPQPPDFAVEVTVTTTPSLHDRALGLILNRHGVTEQQLEQEVDVSVTKFIEAATTHQSNSKLWHDLHKGRITSSLFGNVYRARNSPSLVKRILENR